MTRAWRLTAAIAVIVIGFGLCGYGAADYLRNTPPNVDFATGHKPGTPVHITIQTVGTIGYGLHPLWVSYLVKAPDGKWVHSTSWQLPAHTKIILTNYEYDGTAAPLRNAVWGKITGVQNDVEIVNGKAQHYVYSGDQRGNVAHTFTVPGMGINVPWKGLPGTGSNTPNCTVAPCTTKYHHQVDTVSFTTGRPGQYHWQCLIPCAAGYLNGNGGPMQTLGYMGGFLKVQPTSTQSLQVGR